MHSFRASLLVLALALFAAPTSAVAAAPVVTVPAAIDGTPVVGALLTCDAEYSTVQAASFTVAWYSDGTKARDNADQTEHLVTAGEAGTTITCIVTATNDDGSTPSTSPGVAVPDAAPSFSHLAKADISNGRTCRLTGSSSISGPAARGGHLTTTYTWTVDGAAQAPSTTASVPGVYTSGHRGTCTVTITNALGSASLTSLEEALTAERLSGKTAPSISGSGRTGSPLTCSGGTFSDEPAGAVRSYVWNWSTGGSIDGASFTPVADHAGRTVTCVAKLSIGGSATSTPASLPVVIQASTILVKVDAKQMSARFDTATTKGVGTSLRANVPCQVVSTLTIPAKLAKQFGLLPATSKSTKPFVLGTAKRTIVADKPSLVSVKLSAKVKAKLKRRTKVTQTMVFSSTGLPKVTTTRTFPLT